MLVAIYAKIDPVIWMTSAERVQVLLGPTEDQTFRLCKCVVTCTVLMPIRLAMIALKEVEGMLSLIINITECTLVYNITTPELAAIFCTLPVVASITNESDEKGINEPSGGKEKLSGNHGLRRLGVPGLELNAEPILYGVDVPLLIPGSLTSPEKGESTGVAGLEFVTDCDAILSSLYWFRM